MFVFAITALAIFGWFLGSTYQAIQQHRRNAMLIAAVKHSDTQTVLKLLAQGADANTHDEDSHPLSLWALFRDRLGSKPSSALSGPSVLAIALAWQDSNDDYPPENPALIGALLDYGANPNTVVKSGSMTSSPTANSSGQGSEDLTLLQLTLATGRTNTVALLLKHGANVNGCNASKQTVLMFSAGADDPATTETLLREGAAVDARDTNGQTALMWAAISNSSRCIQLLLDHHADPNIRDQQGRTALDWAKKMGTEDAGRMLAKYL